MAVLRCNNIIAMSITRPPTIGDMAAAKGGISLQHREHAVSIARRHIVALEGKGYTQGEIGKMWGGLSQSTISDLKAGRASKLGLRALLCIRQGLQISLDDLLGLDPIEKGGEPPQSRYVAK